MARPNLLFVDTNIWLDFYRARNENDLKLLKRMGAVKDQLIVTYQLEIEFNANRQRVMVESLTQLKDPEAIPRLGMFSDARDTAMITHNLKDAKKRTTRLRDQLIRALGNPERDAVYQLCQRLFQRSSPLNLERNNLIRRSIRRSAYRRFLHGCPPRKRGDTSYGDAFNWEWMLFCAAQQKTGLVIVSRDSDYGITIKNKSYVNDHLRLEFRDRVGRRRPLLLFERVSDALGSFDVPVSAQEKEAEKLLGLPEYGRVPPYMIFYGDRQLTPEYASRFTMYRPNMVSGSTEPIYFHDMNELSKSPPAVIKQVGDAESLASFGRATPSKAEGNPDKKRK